MTRVVDGDTLDVTRGVASERVRILGIDTPERGDCGFDTAASYLSGLVGRVEQVSLSTAGPGKDEQDSYGRILRYVDAGGVDVGLALITPGYAIARYDSRDGYGAHPREGAVHRGRRSCADEGVRGGTDQRADTAGNTATDACTATATATATQRDEHTGQPGKQQELRRLRHLGGGERLVRE